ncbi:hypothetical protein LTR70_001137 [Exophiala xenobiotica]|uniref:Uncharacterized protein n=1 Tax=Lithohypha guttulata TaxID=1690604 RepID=A0ABR0KMN1_9EURO|nr:hypothetical protein LTR24_000674 [Lithohypha guttulata]KAK5328983.1 hypothetical protein LTR70_001137 [Exophiala xenobiotica]
MNLVISLLSKIELEDVRTAGVEAELSLLAARAGELDRHRLRSGRSFQARMRCVSSADDDAFSWHSTGLQYPLRGELDVSAALQAASDLATASNSTSLLYGSRPKALTRTVLRLRLKNWLVGCGFSEGSKTSSSLVSNTAPIMQAAQSGDILAL